jgi:hypothetical protein
MLGPMMIANGPQVAALTQSGSRGRSMLNPFFDDSEMSDSPAAVFRLAILAPASGLAGPA